MAFRFYNGGNADSVTFPYSVEDRNAFYPVRIPEKDFFELPESIRINGKQYWTNFDITVITRKGPTGVVRVDKDAEETAFTGPIARTDKEARALGDKIHEEYLIGLVQDYINRVEAFKAQGLNPLPAQGYTKYALKKLNVSDPAEPVRNFVLKATEAEKLKELEAKIQHLEALLAKKG
jgi:hypothetical protein